MIANLDKMCYYSALALCLYLSMPFSLFYCIEHSYHCFRYTILIKPWGNKKRIQKRWGKKGVATPIKYCNTKGWHALFILRSIRSSISLISQQSTIEKVKQEKICYPGIVEQFVWTHQRMHLIDRFPNRACLRRWCEFSHFVHSFYLATCAIVPHPHNVYRL